MNMLALMVAAASSLTAVGDSYPHLSPDGQALLFHSNRSGVQAIWVARGDGSEPHLLFAGGVLGSDPGGPVWSPDGGSIAFAMRPADATYESESDVYVMHADGSAVRRLTNAPGDDSHPHWSADGKRIFFNSAHATPDLKAEWRQQWIDIYSMAGDGSDLRRHSDCRNTCTYPAPSPDGRLLAYRRVTATPGLSWELDPVQRNSEVYVTALDGGATVNVSASPAYDGWPTWTPDGRWLLFVSNRDKVARTGQVHAVRPDGSALRAVTIGTLSRVQPSVSADGKHLLVNENVETADTEFGHIASLPIDLPD